VNALKQFLCRHKKHIRNAIIVLLVIVIGFLLYLTKKVNENLVAMANQTAATYYPDYPTVDTSDPNGDLIKHGEYVAKMGDCIACHTDTHNKGPAFAGGLPFITPFGTIYSPNITPDKNTGIGNWSDADFIKAVRHGISPTHQYYYPAFPFPYFNNFTDEDLHALRAYLNAIPAVPRQNYANDMVFPFNIRFMQLGWRILFFHPKENGYVADPNQSDTWNRGAYIVEGPGHCAMCHTPSYVLLSDKIPLGAPIKKYSLAGSNVSGAYAPNIGKSGLGTVPNETIMRVFTHNELVGGGSVVGPMAEVNRDSLHYLSTEDLNSIATYIKTVESETPPKPSSSGSPGAGTYGTYCAGCHSTGAGGAPKYGDAAAWDPLIAQGMQTLYNNAIHGLNSMPPKGTCSSCTDQEIQDAVDYMAHAAQSGTASSSSAGTVEPPPQLTLEDGQKIYETNCAVCHNNGFKNAPKPGDIAAFKPIIAQGFEQTFLTTLHGVGDHPPRGACTNCTDAELKAAVQYMMQTSDPDQNYSLW
jgi:cytochrome c5